MPTNTSSRACSIIRDLHEYHFTDKAWIKKRTRCYDKPLNIYELHLGSWKSKDGQWYTYAEIAEDLIAYLKEYGYNYVEFMPLSEHPFDGSWGYQNTGFYAPTSRYGTASQLMELNGKVSLLLHTDWEPFGGKTPRVARKKMVSTIPPFTGLLYRYQTSLAKSK